MCVGVLMDQTRAAGGEGEVGAGEGVSQREAGCIYARDRQVQLCSSVRLCLPRRPVYIVQLLSSVRLQFLSRSFLNVMCTGTSTCPVAAGDGDRVGNAK